MEEYVYNEREKENCWYKEICNMDKCGEDFCIRHYKMDKLISFTTMEGKQRYPVELYPQKEDYEAFVRLRDIKNNINRFVSEGKNLLIYSKNTGNGKTEWSKKLIFSYLDSIWSTTDLRCRALFISMPRFVFAMKENLSKPNDYYQYVNDNLLNVDLVVWDEINYKDWTSFEAEYMLNIISQRLSKGLSNVYTTNYDLDTIADKLGTRLASRIVGCSEHVELVGKDRRNAGDFKV